MEWQSFRSRAGNDTASVSGGLEKLEAVGECGRTTQRGATCPPAHLTPSERGSTCDRSVFLPRCDPGPATPSGSPPGSPAPNCAQPGRGSKQRSCIALQRRRHDPIRGERRSCPGGWAGHNTLAATFVSGAYEKLHSCRTNSLRERPESLPRNRSGRASAERRCDDRPHPIVEHRHHQCRDR